MCGIAGFIGDFIPGLMARMNAVQARQSPDGLPRAPHGDYDPRVLNSPLQKSVAQRNHGEPTTLSNHTARANPD